MPARDNLTFEINIDKNTKIYEWDQINEKWTLCGMRFDLKIPLSPPKKQQH